MMRWSWPVCFPLYKITTHARSRKPRRPALKRRLILEFLEDRIVPSPVLIQDINTHTLDSNPQGFVAIGNTTYFVADDGFNGYGIWKTDGTSVSLVVSGATVLASALTNVNGTIYFAGRDAAHGAELWKFDGTNASLAADINPGVYDSNPTLLTNVNGTLYFAANDGTHGNELWKYDGTSASLVADLNPGIFGVGPQNLINFNGNLFFSEPVGSNDNLYETTATSTTRVASFLDCGNFTIFNGTLFLAGNDGTHGKELWKSTGTVTTQVADINPGAGSSNPYDLTVFNNALYFGANDGTNGNELWKSNGTTYSLVSATAPDALVNPTVVNSALFYAGTDGTHGHELWKTDGTTTSLVADINPGRASSYPSSLASFNGTLYFAADDGTHGTELWKSDGTTATLVDDIFPGVLNTFPNSSNPNTFVVINGALFFAADDGVHGNELWTTDGTTAGTRLFQDLNLAGVGSDPRSMTNVNGTVFFSANDGVHGYELWKTDGTTTTLFDLNPGPNGSHPLLLTSFNGQLYFLAGDDVNGAQLWKCDGTNASIVNFEPGIATSPGWLTVSNGLLFFSANDGLYNSQLWKTDGTNTSMITINPTGAANPNHLMAINGLLYFVANDGVHGDHLWTTDGTTTTMLPFNLDTLYINLNLNTFQFVYVNGWFYFVASDPATGSELWRTDGTTANLVADINPGANGSNPQFLTAANGRVFFSANDGTHGTELWESDGTTTSLVADIYPGVNGSQPIFLTNVNNTLFFEASDPTNGGGLWQTTGTGATHLGNYSPTGMTAINGMLYFEAIYPPPTLYKTDGTTTTVVSDFTGLSVQDTFLDVNNTLFFEGYDTTHGFEPWKLALTQTSASQLQLVVTPSSGVAGSSFSVTVTAQDASGHTVTTYRGTVHFTSSDPQAVLPADYTFTSTDAGVHSFSATLKTSGSQSLTATDTVTGTITGSQTGITVNPAAATSLAVSGFPSPSTAGVAGSVTVTAKDPYGNTATSYTSTVSFTSSDAQATLPANYTFVTADAGVHAFTATLKTAGSQSLTATDTVTGTITGSQTGITVNPAAASSLAVSGFPSPSTAGVAASVTVTAKDPYGNTATSYTSTVSFTSSDAQATLPANYTFVTADAGVHAFTATLKTAGSQSLTATDTGTSTITGSQTGITVNSAAASSLAVSGFPSPSTAGVAGSVTVTAKDPYGNTATSYTGTVSFTSSDAQATLPANYTFVAADAGVHAFTATLKTGGSQSLTATDTGTSTITGSQTGITVNPAAADHLVFGVQPSNTVAGAAITPAVTVQILDRFNNLVSSDNSDSVGMVIGTNPSNGTLSGTTTVTASGGVATFSTLSINKVGSGYTLNASSGSLTGATSTSFGITPAAASTFTVTGIPSSVISGQAQNFTVTALDTFGNTATGYAGTVRFTSTDTAALLPANYIFVAADAGMHTFSATLETAGTQSLTATDTVTSSITGTEAGILVKPSSFLVNGFPSSTNAGAAQTFSVTAKNANGTTAAGYTGTVHFTSSDAQAVLPADSTLTSGTGTFSATLKTAGTQSITATDTVTSTITGTQSGITVNALAASTLTVAGYPSTTTAGVANNFTVTAKDVYGNTATGYRGTVKFTSSDTKAALPGNYTFTSTDSGVHTFSATLKTVGTQSITATDARTSTITGTQSGITVNPASASTFSVTGFPSPIVAGTAGSFTVTAKDAYGNVATGYLGTVSFSSSDPKATLPANYAFVAADSGVHTFTNGATLKTAGTKSITATDTVTSSIRGTQNGIVVNAASTSMLLVNGFPSPITAGTAGSVTVTAADTYGNKTTGYLGTVHFTSTDAQAVLPANYTFTTTDSGVHTFTNGVTLKTAGNQSITATDTVTSSITGKQTVGVNPAAAATLQVTGFPSPTTAGVSHTFTVKAKDAYGNVATGYLGTVTFTSSDSKAVLPANYIFVAGDHGVHTFSATFKTAGTQSLTATDTLTSSITGTQSGIVVNAAAASVLVVSGFPSPIAHGTSATFTVTAEDAYGNVATGYHGAVKFSSSDTAASLPANYTFTATDAGVHTFTATLNTVGTQSITATDTVTSSITGTQSGIQVTAASVDRLFRDWSPGSAEVDELPELLDNPEAAEQLALVLISTSDSAGAVAGEGHEAIRGRWGAGSQSALGAAVAVLGLHWREGTARRPVSRTRACTSSPMP